MKNEKFKTINYTSPKTHTEIQLEVGEFGTIKHNGKVLRQLIINPIQGYLYAQAPYGFKGILPIHRLVCIAWHGEPCGNRNVVGHIDGNRTNNCESNLKWITRIENNSDKLARKRKSQNARFVKRDNQIIRAVNKKTGEIRYYEYAKQVMVDLKCSHVLVYNVLNPNHFAKTAKGWFLEYIDKKTFIDSFEKMLHSEFNDLKSEIRKARAVFTEGK